MMAHDLHTLLEIPRWPNQRAVQWTKAPDFWEKLTSGATLFTALSQAVKKRSLEDAAQLADALQKAKTILCDKDFDTKWHTVCALVRCAERAVALHEYPVTGLDSAVLAMGGFPPLLKDREDWAWITVRSFLEPPRRSVRVPVVGWDPTGEVGGSLRTLVLEVFERGAGRLAPHPATVFETTIDNDFRESMMHAWDAALSLAQQHQADIGIYDGRWQLLENQAFARQANGPSAGGAAALGFYHALRNTVPDEALIVTAEVHSSGALKEVDGIPAKVKAIANAGRFDTIVVASEKNKTEARRVLDKLEKGSAIRVGTPEELLRLQASHARPRVGAVP